VTLSSAGAILGLAAAIVAIGGGALGAYRGLAALYSKTIGSRRRLSNRLNQLAAGVTLRWMEDRLGDPAFVREFRPPGIKGRLGLRELVYRDRHAWIQVLVDEHEAVARFSITVTDPRFRFPISDLTFGNMTAKLGRTTFSGIRSQLEQQGQSLRMGAHNFEYAEAYWFGNPGNYQWYVLSHNDAGTGNFDFTVSERVRPMFQDGVLKSEDTDYPKYDFHSEEAAQFRAKTTVNTLTVLGPWRTDAQAGESVRMSLAEPRGPDSNQVRVLVPDSRERRQRRRQIRQWNRRSLREAKRQQKRAALKTTGDADESQHPGLTRTADKP
jgi:hypothetical protein